MIQEFVADKPEVHARLTGKHVFDAAIVGSGPAGMSLAIGLARQGRHVALLEGGGSELSLDSQDVYDGDILGHEYHSLDSVRERSLGGTSNRWTGRCVKLDAVDFAARPWLNSEGWPLRRTDLEPYYEEARQWVELPPLLDGPAFWDKHGIGFPAFAPLEITATVDQRSPPTQFAQRYERELRELDGLDVWLHANVVKIELDDGCGRVACLGIKNYRGDTAQVRARHYVMACGGIENARLFLVNREQCRQGIGNAHDLVGRFFAEHAHMIIGDIHLDAYHRLLDRLGPQFRDGTKYCPRFSLTALEQERLGVSNCTLWLHPRSARTGAVAAMAGFYEALRKGEWPDDAGKLSHQMLKDPAAVASAAYRRIVEGRKTLKPIDSVHLIGNIDQMPNPDSRVILADDRDDLGLPRAALDWRMKGEDIVSLRRLAEAFAGGLATNDLGRVRFHPWFVEAGGDKWFDQFLASKEHRQFAEINPISFHHMGTTRMAEQPQDGVVDADCRVHGMDNLYVAGSSVFPTYGGAQPTLTIIALAQRLRDHLLDRLV